MRVTSLINYFKFCTPLPVCRFVYFIFSIIIYPHFVFTLATDPCSHPVLHHYTTPLHNSTFPILLNFTTFCCLLHFLTLQPQNPSNFAHLLLHLSTSTFYYAILLNFYNTWLCYTFQLCSCKPSFDNFIHFLPYKATLTTVPKFKAVRTPIRRRSHSSCSGFGRYTF